MSIHETMKGLLGNPKFLTAAVVSFGGANAAHRYSSSVEGSDGFARHTAQQHSDLTRFLTGMHSPYFAPRAAEVFDTANKHFPDYSRLLNLSTASFQEKSLLETPVVILPLSKCALSKEELEV